MVRHSARHPRQGINLAHFARTHSRRRASLDFSWRKAVKLGLTESASKDSLATLLPTFSLSRKNRPRGADALPMTPIRALLRRESAELLRRSQELKQRGDELRRHCREVLSRCDEVMTATRIDLLRYPVTELP
jgi:hypothetical protein